MNIKTKEARHLSKGHLMGMWNMQKVNKDHNFQTNQTKKSQFMRIIMIWNNLNIKKRCKEIKKRRFVAIVLTKTCIRKRLNKESCKENKKKTFIGNCNQIMSK